MSQWLDKKGEQTSDTPPIRIEITLTGLVDDLMRRLGTPDGNALRVRDGVAPRP